MTYLKSLIKEIEKQVSKPIRVVLPVSIDEAKVDLERGIIAIPLEKGTEVILLPSQAKEGELKEFRERALRDMVVDYRLIKRVIELVWGSLKEESEVEEVERERYYQKRKKETEIPPHREVEVFKREAEEKKLDFASEKDFEEESFPREKINPKREVEEEEKDDFDEALY